MRRHQLSTKTKRDSGRNQKSQKLFNSNAGSHSGTVLVKTLLARHDMTDTLLPASL